MEGSTPGWVRGCRLLDALIVAVAILAQAWQSLARDDLPAARFFGYFTIQSSVFAAGVLAWGAMRPGDPHQTARQTARRDLVRGAAVLYLVITGLVYGVLLAGRPAAQHAAIPWVNMVLHQLLPLVVVADWLIDPPTPALTLRRALAWLVYPLAYVAVILVRGNAGGWYPYPFLDPARAGGPIGVAATCLGIAVATLALTWLIVAVGRHVRLVVT